MKTSIAAKLDQARQRLGDINALLSSEGATRDMEQFRRLSREHAELEPVVELFNKYRDAEQDVAEAQELLADPEMRNYAESEIKTGRERLVALESELQKLLLPRDPNDERNIFLEIRAGTGGGAPAAFPAGPVLPDTPPPSSHGRPGGGGAETHAGRRGGTEV